MLGCNGCWVYKRSQNHARLVINYCLPLVNYRRELRTLTEITNYVAFIYTDINNLENALNVRRWPKAGPMPVERLRRRTHIKPTHAVCLTPADNLWFKQKKSVILKQNKKNAVCLAPADNPHYLFATTYHMCIIHSSYLILIDFGAGNIFPHILLMPVNYTLSSQHLYFHNIQWFFWNVT